MLGVDPAQARRRLAQPRRRRAAGVERRARPDRARVPAALLRLLPRAADIDETIALVGLDEKADALGPQLSGGQRRRLDVALALIGDPELIFLDEPTTGFDPSARRTAWHVIDGLRALGKTVFLTTHYMDEAEHLADRIAVIAGGRIVAEGTPGTLGGRNRMAATITFTLPAGIGADDLPAELRAPARRARTVPRRSRRDTPLVHVRALADWAIGRGLDLPDLEVRRPTLEDVYLELTKSRHEDARRARLPLRSSSTRRATTCSGSSATGRRASSRSPCRCSSSSSSSASSATTVRRGVQALDLLRARHLGARRSSPRRSSTS